MIMNKIKTMIFPVMIIAVIALGIRMINNNRLVTHATNAKTNNSMASFCTNQKLIFGDIICVKVEIHKSYVSYMAESGDRSVLVRDFNKSYLFGGWVRRKSKQFIDGFTGKQEVSKYDP